jgi:uncharacterized membrane protein YgcG
MKDKNSNRKSAVRQANVEPTLYQQGRWSARDGAFKTLVKGNEILGKNGPPTSKMGTIVFAGRIIAAGGKDYVNAAKYFSKGFMEGVSWQTGDKTPGADKIITRHAIEQGRAKAQQTTQNSKYTPKARPMNSPSTSKAVLKQSNTNASRTSQSPSQAIRNPSRGSTRGTSTNIGKSAGIGKSSSSSKSRGGSGGGQSRGGGQRR